LEHERAVLEIDHDELPVADFARNDLLGKLGFYLSLDEPL
jgi:hypothetical protein